VDIGQSNVPWVVLADPEGNELCALDPRDRYQASGAVAAVVVDALDPASLARFWAAATGWTLTDSGPNGAALHPTTRRGRPGPAGPGRPVGPGKPVGPVGPVKPVGPVGPVGPVKPVGPGRPVGRVGPVGPVRPAVGPFLEFVPTELAPRVKNRLHLDIRPEPGGDQDAEVERLIRLGAHPVEIGQSAAPPGQVHWVVLADPEGNEFCVLRTPG
jgi:predicted enzyme related to lactoylglutathione lyase